MCSSDLPIRRIGNAAVGRAGGGEDLLVDLVGLLQTNDALDAGVAALGVRLCGVIMAAPVTTIYRR